MKPELDIVAAPSAPEPVRHYMDGRKLLKCFLVGMVSVVPLWWAIYTVLPS